MCVLSCVRIPIIALVLCCLAGITTYSSAQTPRKSSEVKRKSSQEREREKEQEKSKPQMGVLNARVAVESWDSVGDTITFHIGAPVFFRMRISGDERLCAPMNGQFFYFDASNAQLGWGFEEVSDSLLFPDQRSGCYRVVMLSSENSNRLAEGYYTFKTTVYLDSKKSVSSNTLVLHPVHSSTGATSVSYLRFLMEQILKNISVLRDPATLQAMFGTDEYRNGESELYHAVALYKINDIPSAAEAIRRSDELYGKASLKRSVQADAIRNALQALIRARAETK